LCARGSNRASIPGPSTSPLAGMKYVIATAVVGLGFGLMLRHYGGGEPVGICMLVALVGFPLVGLLTTIDDFFPGGWGSSARHAFPSWEEWADLPARAAVSGIGFGIDLWGSWAAALSLLVGVLGLALSYVLHRRMARMAVLPANNRWRVP